MSYKYYKWVVSAIGAGSWLRIFELELLNGGADQCTGGTATDSGHYSADGPANAFNNNNNDCWNSGFSTGGNWIKYYLAAGITCDSYSVRSKPSVAPKNWVLYGSNDDSTWDVLDIQTNQTWASDLIRKVYTIDYVTPLVYEFVLPATSSSMTIPITSFNTTAPGVAWMITTSSTPPAADDPGWLGTKPTSVTSPDVGIVKFYPWAKSATGVVSAVSSYYQTCTVSPTITQITGLTAGRTISDVKITKLADGTYLMLFTYQSETDATGSIYNIWYSTSTDLVTWAEALPLTNTSLKSQDYSQPDVVQKSNGDLFISFLESNTYLLMTNATTGWVQSAGAGQDLNPGDMWVDSAAGNLYVISFDNNRFRGAAKIDIDTWTITKCFSGTNTPAIPEYFMNMQPQAGRQHGDGPLAPIVGSQAICLLDFDNDNHKSFFFYDLSGTYGETHQVNVNWTPNHEISNPSIQGAWVDYAANRLYVSLPKGYFYDNGYQFGYIDLDQPGPTYDFTELIKGDVEGGNNAHWMDNFRVYPDDDIVLLYGASGDWGGRLVIWSISANAIYKFYRESDYPDFPADGVIDAVLVGDKVFATVCYSGAVTTEDYKYWLMEIDLTTDVMIYHYPPFTGTKRFSGATQSTGSFYGRIYQCTATTELIIDGSVDPVVFNYSTYTWESLDYNASGGGPTPTGNWWEGLIYDPTSENYFGFKNDNQLYLLPRSGSANRISYTEGTLGSMSAIAVLVNGYHNSQNQIAVSETDEVWSFWNDAAVATDNISWGKTEADSEVTSYLTGELSLEWNIDGTPNRLTFSMSHGYLFDPSNPTSIMSYYLEKGNIAVLRLGERVSGVNYWANQGTFIIREIKLNYKRGNYPTVDIVCEDMRCLWGMHQVTATQVTSSNPDDAIISIVKANTELVDADFDMPTFAGEFEFDAQWIDAYLSDIITDIANRWQYFLMVDTDNKLTAKLINPDATVSNTYSTSNQIIEFTPDDSFSDLTNRITVTGQSLDDIEVIYSEERLGGLAGTIGWWGFQKDFTVNYSDDKSKRAKFPRLKVLESSTSVMFSLAGSVTERISDTDEYNKYCVVTITAPNLTPILVAAIAGWVAAHYIPDKVASTVAGVTIPWGRVIESTFLMVALNVLGSVANYQFEIWGRPMGYVKRDYSASANDTTLQSKIGMVIEQKHEGFLCYTQDQCQTVADFEMQLAMLQRNRVSFTKTAHLQDEVGDVISILHPYTGTALSVLITNISRKYKPENNGHFLDEIEGWVV